MTTARERSERMDPRLTHLLAGSAMGVYLLVMVGAGTALLDGGAACPTWPACDGRWVVSPAAPALAIAWGHRVAALLVGALLAVTVLTAIRRDASRRVSAALVGAVALYPVQMGLGGLTAVREGATVFTAVHLLVALVIFTGVMLALLFHLERGSPASVGRETGSDGDARVAATSGDSGARAVGVDPASADAPPAGVADAGTTTTDAGLGQTAMAYVRLTKPKLWWLLCLVAVAAMALAAGPSLRVGTVVVTLVGGVFAVGASGTFNNVLERDRDARMERTADRPLVDGTIPVRRAVAFGVTLTIGSVAVFLAFVNVLAATLGVLAVLFYTVVYTLILKPNTTQNVVIGGAVGAFPALIGWAAVENAVGVPALVLGTVIFLWTPAHFYNLALAYREDYERAGFPMLPVEHGEAVTRRHVTLYLCATMVGAVLLGTAPGLGWVFAVTAVIAGGTFLGAVVLLHRERTERAAFRAFHASNAYLGSLLLVVAVDAIVL